MCSKTGPAPCIIGVAGGALACPVTANIVGHAIFMATARARSSVRWAHLPLSLVALCLNTM